MSLSVTTDVFCDAPHCMAWIDGVQGRVKVAAREARDRARVYGWVRRSGLDLCPDHRDIDITTITQEAS